MNNIETFGMGGGGWRHFLNAPCTLVILYLAGGVVVGLGFFLCVGVGMGWGVSDYDYEPPP